MKKGEGLQAALIVIGLVFIAGVTLFMSPDATVTGDAVSQVQEYKHCLDGSSQAYCMCAIARDLPGYCEELLLSNPDAMQFESCIAQRPGRSVNSHVMYVNEMRSNYWACKEFLY